MLIFAISTHTPRAGRDLGAVYRNTVADISTHTPRAGRDKNGERQTQSRTISTHTPRAGRDKRFVLTVRTHTDFYSHAPCGARPAAGGTGCYHRDNFYSHAPCGARHRPI